MACHGGPNIIEDNLVLYLDAGNTKSFTLNINLSSWSRASAAESFNDWQTIAYGNGKFVAVSKDGSNRVMYASDSDITSWTSASSAVNNNWRSVTYGNGKFVAVGGSNVTYASDSDLTSWTSASAAESNSWRGVIYGNGKFVAVSSNGTNRVAYASDSDLSSWTAASAAEANAWRSVTYGGSKFVAVAAGGSNRVMYSTDGINWTSASAAENNSWRSVTYGGSKFVAVSATGTNRVMYSTDGINWTSASAAENNSWRSVIYGDGKFVAVAASGTNRVMHSSDGINWTSASAAQSNSWMGVTYGNKRFVAVSEDGFTSSQVMYSGYGTNWTDMMGVNNGTIIGATWSNGEFTFDGNSDEITLGATADIQVQDVDWAWESWFRIDSSASSYNYLFAYGPPHQIASYNNQLNVFLNDTDSLSGYNLTMSSGSNTVPTGQWTHGVVSRIGSSWKIYINGEEKTSATASFTVAISSIGPRIGSYDGSQSDYFLDGKIANTCIYKGKGLTAAEVKQNYNALKRRYGS